MSCKTDMLERRNGFAYLICRSLAHLGNSWAQQNYPRRTIIFVLKNDYCQLAKISRQQLEGRFNWEFREFVSGEDWVKEKESSARAMRKREIDQVQIQTCIGRSCNRPVDKYILEACDGMRHRNEDAIKSNTRRAR